MIGQRGADPLAEQRRFLDQGGDQGVPVRHPGPGDCKAEIGRTVLLAEQAGIAAVEQVKLDHAGWKGDPPEPVAQGWKHFLGSMKSYLETGAGQPW